MRSVLAKFIFLMLLGVKIFASCDEALMDSFEGVSRHEYYETARYLQSVLGATQRYRGEGSLGQTYLKNLEIDNFSFESNVPPDVMTRQRLKDLWEEEIKNGEDDGWITADLLHGKDAKNFLNAFRDSVQGKGKNLFFREMKKNKPTWGRVSSRTSLNFFSNAIKQISFAAGCMGGAWAIGSLINPNMDWRGFVIAGALLTGVVNFQSAFFHRPHIRIREGLDARYENAKSKWLSFKKLAEQIKELRIPTETREGLVEALDPETLSKKPVEYRWVEWKVTHNLRVTFLMEQNPYNFFLSYFVWEKYK